jgi:hypothetical protein
MGVHIFKSKYLNVYKIGHFKGWNAWGRVAFRGFNSCKVPIEIENRVNAMDLELTRWFPFLNQTDEKMIHRELTKNGYKTIGEWYFVFQEILDYCDSLDIDQSSNCSLAYCVEYIDYVKLGLTSNNIH